jgi:hypothetical protein
MLFSPDTSPEARRILIARLRAMPPSARFAAMADLVNLGLRLAGQVGPSSDPATRIRRARFLRRWLGPELAAGVLAEEERRLGPG